jgi:hypothetical protein
MTSSILVIKDGKQEALSKASDGNDKAPVFNDSTGLWELQTKNCFGEEYEYTDVASFLTTSATFVDALALSVTKPAGNYRLGWSYNVSNSKSNTDNESQIVFDAVSIFSRAQEALFENSIASFEGNLVHAGGTLSAMIQLRRTAGNGNAIVSDVKLELWRIS